MPVTMQQVLAAINPDEPDYALAASLGPDAVPHLERLIRSPNLMLATKATYLASMIRDDRAYAALAQASRSHEVLLRVAAAGGAQNLPEPAASELVLRLLADVDDGVRKIAINSVQAGATAALRERLFDLAINDPVPYLRQTAAHALYLQVNPGLFVNYDPPGRDVDYEYIVVRNNGSSPIELSGWRITDAVQHTFRFPAFTLAPGQEVKVWTGRGTPDAHNLYANRTQAIWNNTGDVAKLYDTRGIQITATAYRVP